MGRGRSPMPLTTSPSQAEGWGRPPPSSLPSLHISSECPARPALKELAFQGGDREYTGGINDQEGKGP